MNAPLFIAALIMAFITYVIYIGFYALWTAVGYSPEFSAGFGVVAALLILSPPRIKK